MSLPAGYVEYAPPEALNDVVACFWSRVDGSIETANPVLPDGCTDLIWTDSAGILAAGPDTHAMPAGEVVADSYVGVRFRPGAGGGALGLPLHEAQNSRLDVDQLWGARPAVERSLVARDLLRACDASDTAEGAMAALRRYAFATAETARTRALAGAAARRLMRPGARIAALADDLGVGQRRLHRVFLDDVGYGPKTLQRVFRFRRFLASPDPSATLAARAAASGYADQSHLTRDCVELSGMTPAALSTLWHG